MTERQEIAQGLTVSHFYVGHEPTDIQISQTAGLYVEVFAGHPWFESHDPDEVKKQAVDFFERSSANMYLVESDGEVKGFAWGYLRDTAELVESKFGDSSDSEIAMAVTSGIGQGTVFYINEVGVDGNFRGKGLGKLLMGKLLDDAERLGVPSALSTRVDTILTPICLKLGFEQTFGQEVVIGENGKISTTGRIIAGQKDEPERTFFIKR